MSRSNPYFIVRTKIILFGMLAALVMETSCHNDSSSMKVHTNGLRVLVEASEDFKGLLEHNPWKDTSYAIHGRSGDTTYIMTGSYDGVRGYAVEEQLRYPLATTAADTTWAQEQHMYEGYYDKDGQTSVSNSFVLTNYAHSRVNTDTGDTLSYVDVEYRNKNNMFKDMEYEVTIQTDSLEFINQQTEKMPSFWSEQLLRYARNVELITDQIVGDGYYERMDEAQERRERFKEIYPQYELQ